MVQLDDRQSCEVLGALLDFARLQIYKGSLQDIDPVRFPRRKQIFAIGITPSGDRKLLLQMPRFRKARCLSLNGRETIERIEGWQTTCLRSVFFIESGELK